ncbi:uncharacterized protein J4E84_008687 [Alternaria hordeiaustralica]|uniref:uncharacterized protein n=1 Tax=Alternaria hordeiaustralica TaxID=1187925 RepID=UPI0020C3A4CE|nr:uncharacterized protein J4E84_008687 [Alternaria hordeiaustralica]KAI4678432.1 hypothetical protein J4E84_008687 [Alternaria hordeiaustralica]
MPSFLHASDRRCAEFIMHPDAHRVRLPSGSELYFTLPIHLDTQQPMPPQDLEALAAYLERTPPHPSEGPSGPTHQNNLEVRSLISDWLQGSQYLDDLEMYAWESGHGFPIFDEFGMPVDFQWVWDVIAFEGGEELVSRYVEYINDSAELHAQAHAEDHHESAPTDPATRVSHMPPPGSPLEQPQHHRFGRFRVATQSDGPVSVGGADFANMDDCLAFLDTLTDIEAKLLSKNIIQLEGDSSTGLRMVPGPNAKFLPERASQAKKEPVQIHASPADHRIRHVHVQQADLQPAQIQTIAANPPSRNIIIRQEDQGPQPIVFLHKNPVKQEKKPIQEQKLTFKRVASPPKQTVAAELDPFRFYGRELTHEARNQAANDQRLIEELQSLWNESQNLADNYHQVSGTPPTWHAKDPRKAYNKVVTIDLRGQDAPGFRPLFPLSDVKPSKESTLAHKSTPAPKTAHFISADARRKVFGAEPSAHRSVSFQEPTRLPMRPRVTGISPSHGAVVDDPAHRMCGTNAHQARAEDSPEDSPRPASGGSWMDVFEELMS